MRNATKAIPSPDMVRVPLTSVVATTWSDANLLGCPLCCDLTVSVVDIGRIVDGQDLTVLVTLACTAGHQFFIEFEGSHGTTTVTAGGSASQETGR